MVDGKRRAVADESNPKAGDRNAPDGRGSTLQNLRFAFFNLHFSIAVVWLEMSLPHGWAQDLAFDSLVHDFGTVFSHEIYQHTFTARNTGEAAVTIMEVTADCACTLAKEAKGPVKPGETAKLQVALNTENYSGPISKTLRVRTDAPSQGEITLTLKAHVLQQGLSLTPRHVVLGRVKRGESVERVIQVSMLSRNEPVKVTKVVPSAKWLEARLEARRDGEGLAGRPERPPQGGTPNQAAYVLTLRLNLKEAPAGHFLEFVTVYTDSSRWPFEDVQVKGEVAE